MDPAKKKSRNKSGNHTLASNIEKMGANLSANRVKQLVLQDEEIGSVNAEATSLIARSLDVFLADLAKASVERTKATRGRTGDEVAGVLLIAPHPHRENPSFRGKWRRQILPEDLQHAVEEEDRFDFLRPVLETLDDRQAAYREQAKMKPNRAGRPRGKGSKPAGNTTDHGCRGSTSSAALGSAVTAAAGGRPGSMLSEQALLGSEDNLRQASLLMRDGRAWGTAGGIGAATGGGASSRVEGEEEVDDDYDNC